MVVKDGRERRLAITGAGTGGKRERKKGVSTDNARACISYGT